MIELKSKRLLFEPIGMKHLSEDYVDWMNDLEVIKYMDSGGDYSLEKLKNFLLEQERKKILFWAIIVKETNKHIGNIKIDPIDHENNSAEYGIMIGDKREWGKGYAQEASEMIINYCLNKLNINQITLGVKDSNLKAIKLYEELGFQKISKLKFPLKYKDVCGDGIRMVHDKSINKVVLGTAQFGMDYGINNKHGKIQQDQIFKILNYSYDNGIRSLDTAELYGNSIDMIGKFHKKFPNKKFKIFSKSAFGDSIDYSQNIKLNIKKLGIKKYEGYMIHNYEFFKKNQDLYISIKQAKESGYIKKTGVSLYTNDEIKEVVELGLFDFIQIPFNLLDNSTKRKSIIKYAKSKGLEIQVRSIFLQGLFFKSQSSIPEKLAPLIKYLTELNQISLKLDIDINNLAIKYAIEKKYIDKVIFGVDDFCQLEENISATNSKTDIPSVEIDTINVTEDKLLNPSNW
ncbi:MAG: hypothetical protein CMJ05_08595 [Pelagibacterales bacterium]|nr:hypothetical protein [Pelagibacterales bacterium]|tara:strand:- start:27445 stop:28818 length:1374 start_codon:yes stop_codon:yes gene_type:complete